MNKVVVWLSAVASVGVIALSVSTTACNGGSCDFVSKCSADPVQNQDQITACNNRLNNSACGGKYSDYLGCFQSHQACTSSGITDENITNGTCGVQYQAWISCCFGTEGGVADGGFPQCGQ
jgi:hypothetical protein